MAPVIPLLALFGLTFAPTPWSPCGPAVNAAVEDAWVRYRAGDMEVAGQAFESARRRCPEHIGARVGLGYVALRSDDRPTATRWFEAVLDDDPLNVDALVGLGIVLRRTGENVGAERLFRRVLELDPNHAEALEFLGVAAPVRPVARPPLRLPDTVEAVARTAGDRFEVLRGGRWQPIYLNGVNLGAALPGRYPSEFPARDVYAAWIAELAELRANTIRVYTIHPPAFYDALAAHNRANSFRPILLVHGVWTELPPDHDFDDADWRGAFEEEMRRVVDVIHGRADIRHRPGHASGSYGSNVSPWTLGYIIGREWEPYAVEAFNLAHPDMTDWRGRYLEISGGTATDVWLTQVMEHMITYETETYRIQRPIAYTSWPTLDPLHHVTEPTADEEVAIRRRLGESVGRAPLEYDNDAVDLDPMLIRATTAFRGGVFAAYHAYPYYPDFMILDPAYSVAESPWGRSNYYGYLTALKARHPGMPVVIAEYGVPASLGSSHLQPQGWHHGGHTQTGMAEINARMTREIASAGMAGGIVFAWIDEWFKHNWLVIDKELPRHRNRLWLNLLDPEQMYGIIALEPLPPVAGATLAERLAGWGSVPPVIDQPSVGRLRAAADAAQLWLLLEPAGHDTEEWFIGFDVVRPDAGAFRWPGRRGPFLPMGVEFVLQVDGNGVRILADPSANPFRHTPRSRLRAPRSVTPDIDPAPPGYFIDRLEQRYNSPLIPRISHDGGYDSLRVMTNRMRYGRDGTEYPALGYDRGILLPGEPPDGHWMRDHGSGAIEIRIPWLLINVSDPSGRHVLYGGDGSGFHYESVDDIGIVLARPVANGQWSQAAARFSWDTWEEPEWRSRRRPVFEALRDAFLELEDNS